MRDPAHVSAIVPTRDQRALAVACVRSLLASRYPSFEVIVVDNASSDCTAETLEQTFGSDTRFRLIRSNKNRGAGGGRNLGAQAARGELLLFVDCDNIVDQEMMSYLVDFLVTHDECAMIGPLMLHQEDSRIIWIYSADINFYTSRASYQGTGERDRHQYPEVVEVGHLPNCFMVRATDFRTTGGFDEQYAVIYEEADFAETIKKATRKKIYLFTRARTYHHVPLSYIGTLGFRTPQRAYLTARNRVYFMRKHTSPLQWLTFLLFLPFMTGYYVVRLIRQRAWRFLGLYLKGTVVGFLLPVKREMDHRRTESWDRPASACHT